MIVALVLLGAGSIALLLRAHFASLRAWDRPAWARDARALRVLRAAGWALVLGGAVLLAWRSLAAGLVVLAILAGAFAWTRWTRSSGYLARGLLREMERLRQASPERDEREILRDVVLARHPRWGEDLAEQIVAEQGSARRVAEMLVRMERTAGPDQ